MIEYIINDMKTFFISLLATCTFVFFAWRIKRFGLLVSSQHQSVRLKGVLIAYLDTL